MKNCFKYGGAMIVMPEQGVNDILQFKDYSKQLEAPFRIDCDFEALTKKLEILRRELNKYMKYVDTLYVLNHHIRRI